MYHSHYSVLKKKSYENVLSTIHPYELTDMYETLLNVPVLE